VQPDPLIDAPDSEAWWDVPVAEVAGLDSTRAARETYEQNKRTQRQYVT
jgi:3D-(3,5/4)-trihydroxycyclohexane-1,2-dione acylhydrolase (decyclizing)